MEIGTQHVLFAWSDIQEYRAIPTVDYRFTKAKQVTAVDCAAPRFFSMSIGTLMVKSKGCPPEAEQFFRRCFLYSRLSGGARLRCVLTALAEFLAF